MNTEYTELYEKTKDEILKGKGFIAINYLKKRLKKDYIETRLTERKTLVKDIIELIEKIEPFIDQKSQTFIEIHKVKEMYNDSDIDLTYRFKEFDIDYDIIESKKKEVPIYSKRLSELFTNDIIYITELPLNENYTISGELLFRYYSEGFNSGISNNNIEILDAYSEYKEKQGKKELKLSDFKRLGTLAYIISNFKNKEIDNDIIKNSEEIKDILKSYENNTDIEKRLNIWFDFINKKIFDYMQRIYLTEVNIKSAVFSKKIKEVFYEYEIPKNELLIPNSILYKYFSNDQKSKDFAYYTLLSRAKRYYISNLIPKLSIISKSKNPKSIIERNIIELENEEIKYNETFEYKRFKDEYYKYFTYEQGLKPISFENFFISDVDKIVTIYAKYHFLKEFINQRILLFEKPILRLAEFSNKTFSCDEIAETFLSLSTHVERYLFLLLMLENKFFEFSNIDKKFKRCVEHLLKEYYKDGKDRTFNNSTIREYFETAENIKSLKRNKYGVSKKVDEYLVSIKPIFENYIEIQKQIDEIISYKD